MELCINNLTKQFKDKLAVDHVSLTITPGVWGLLGANGAGKTTLMRMAAGLLLPTEGTVTYDGVPIDVLGKSYRDIFGYLPQEFGFYPEFTVYDYLDYVAAERSLQKKSKGKDRPAAGDLYPGGCEEKEDHKAFRRNETAGGHCPGSFKRPKGTDPG